MLGIAEAHGSWVLIHNAADTSKAVAGRAAGTWNYRVRGCNTAGCGGWSAMKAVQSIHPPAGAPVLTAPATNATGSYTLSWTGVASSERYELQERLSTGGWVSIHDASATSKTLAGKTTGNWGYRVRACNVAGCTAYTAEKVVAVTRPPVSAPTVTVPATNTTGSYTANWTTVAAATTYELQERLETGSWNTIHNAAGTSKAVSGRGTGTWGYQVRGCNSSGCGGWSLVAAVVVTMPPATPPTITASIKYQRYVDQLIQIRCAVSWTPVASATTYELQAYGGATQYTGPLTSVAGVFSSASYCAATQVVRACNSTGCSAWSSPPFPQILKVLNEPGEPGNPLSDGEAAQGEGP